MDGRQLWLAVLAIFLLAGALSGIVDATHWVDGWTGGFILFVALVLVMSATAALASSSSRTPSRSLFGVVAGIIGVGLLGWSVFSPELALGLRLGASLTLLSVIPRAWRRTARRVEAGPGVDHVR